MTVVTDPVQAGAIKLRNRFLLFLGEWFRDSRVGVPWLTQILVKGPSLTIVQEIFRQVIVTTPPFIDVRDLIISPLASGTRRMDVSFTAVVDPAVRAGAIVTATSLNVPFIVDIST